MAKVYLEPDEVKRLEDAATYVRDRLLIRLLYHLGCCITEAVTLEVKDVDFGARTVTILHLKTRIKLACPDCGARLGKSHTFCPKCGGKVAAAVARAQEHKRLRTLPVDPDTLDMLKRFIKGGGPVERDGKRLIFGINRHRGWQVISECALRAGLPKLVNPETGKVHNVSPHRLRDAFAVNAVKHDDSGDGLRMLQEHLGHASFNTTARYRKVSGKEQKDWYSKLWSKEQESDGTQAE